MRTVARLRRRAIRRGLGSWTRRRWWARQHRGRTRCWRSCRFAAAPTLLSGGCPLEPMFLAGDRGEDTGSNRGIRRGCIHRVRPSPPRAVGSVSADGCLWPATPSASRRGRRMQVRCGGQCPGPTAERRRCGQHRHRRCWMGLSSGLTHLPCLSRTLLVVNCLYVSLRPMAVVCSWHAGAARMRRTARSRTGSTELRLISPLLPVASCRTVCAADGWCIVAPPASVGAGC